ncbi:MAG: LPS export ABC transporter permease LptG [Acidobacteria bacterium]|nr:LPS export ABC transporter permease LptG [Acidobacteriota bacterium]
MRRLDRYILAQILGPLALGFLVYTFILLLQYLFSSAEMIIQRGLPASTVGRLLLLVLPSSVVLTIPMSLLFAILIAVGRLAADSELVALRSCGISLMTLYRPILLLSSALCALNIYLMVSVLPHGNFALQQLNLEILTQSVSQQVEPRVFHEQWDGKVLYVFEVPPGQKRWKGVFLAQSLPGDQQEIIVADWGEVRVDPDGERLVLGLENAVTHRVDVRNPDAYNISQQEVLETVLEDQFTTRRKAKISASKSLREMDLGELRERARDPDVSAEMRNLARVQIHKSFSIPVACLVFGLVALPLGFNNRRGGKTSGFALSIAVILVYWVLLTNGEEAARYGKIQPWVAMWAPNVLLGAAGLFLLLRRNSDKSLLLSRFDHWVRGDLWAWLRQLSGWVRSRRRRRAQNRATVAEQRRRVPAGHLDPDRAEGAGNRIVLRLPRLQLPVPSLLDRYVARAFVMVLGLVFLSGITLYIIGDLGENIDDMLKNHVSQGLIFNYYKFLSLQIVYDIAPIVVLVTTLITFSLLSRSNELTAFKALGVSLFRLALPALALAALVAAFNVYLQSAVLPASNERVAQIKDQIKGRKSARTYRRADRQWLFGQGRYVYNYVHYDPKREALERLQIFEFDENYRLSRRLYAARATYNGSGWIIEDGWKRSFDGPLVTDYERFREPRLSDYPETPDYFTSEIRPPEQMRFRELARYIDELEERGQQVPELRVELHNKIAYPFISLIMALVALPFAFRLGKQGALYGVGLSVVLGMVFMAVFVLFRTLGTAGALPPMLAVWAPSLVFATVALYLLLGVRT